MRDRPSLVMEPGRPGRSGGASQGLHRTSMSGWPEDPWRAVWQCRRHTSLDALVVGKPGALWHTETTRKLHCDLPGDTAQLCLQAFQHPFSLFFNIHFLCEAQGSLQCRLGWGGGSGLHEPSS